MLGRMIEVTLELELIQLYHLIAEMIKTFIQQHTGNRPLSHIESVDLSIMICVSAVSDVRQHQSIDEKYTALDIQTCDLFFFC